MTAPFTSSVQFYGPGISTPFANPDLLTVTQSEFAHDIATLKFWGGDANSSSLISGTPVLISFGRSSMRRTFYGYVNHPERDNNALSTVRSLSERNATTVNCVGASWPMKEAGTQSWKNVLAYDVVAEIAQQFGLAFNGVPDSTPWPSLQMAGKSYWQFCVQLAKQIGYTFYCSGVQLVFKPRQTNPAALSNLAAVYDYKGDPGGLPVFRAVLGASSPAGGHLATRKLYGIDPRTLQVVSSVTAGSPAPTILGLASDVPPFDVVEHYVVDSQAEATAKTNGAGATNQLYITAQALAVGNPLISQGSMVFIQNANGSQNGLWFVTEAEHRLDNRTYEIYLELGRDSMGASPYLGVVPSTQSLPTAYLTQSGAWLAA